MAHHTVRSGYESLVDRLNRLPQGAPPSDALYGILKLLFSENEAGLVALLPIRPFTAGDAAMAWKMNGERSAEGAGRPGRPRHPARRHLTRRRHDLHPAAADGRLLRVLDDAAARRCRPESCWPSCSTSTSTSRKISSRALFMSETRLGRAFVNEDALLPRTCAHRAGLRAGERSDAHASKRSVRHLLLPAQDDAHGRACDAPMDICMTFNGVQRLAHPPRLCARDRRCRMPGPAAGSARPRAGAVRRKRPEGRRTSSATAAAVAARR